MRNSELDKLYINNKERKSFQWELWPECNNFCSFCYLGDSNKEGTKERHLKSLNDLQKILDDFDYEKYNNVSLIGGEFFQGQLNDPELHDKFMKMIATISRLYAEKKIGSVWITVTLTTGNQKHLYEVMDIFEKDGVRPLPEYGASGIWLCTSWDSAGRFHTQKNLENWDFHMKNLYKKYPWIKFNTTIILQEKFILDYLNNLWSPKKFMEDYNTTLFYKQCGIGSIDDSLFESFGNNFGERYLAAKKWVNNKLGYNFFPKREDFIAFLRKYSEEDLDTFDRLYNIKYRADDLFRNFNDEDVAVVNVRYKDGINPENNTTPSNICGHLYEYAAYIDNNHCAICDKNNILDVL